MTRQVRDWERRRRAADLLRLRAWVHHRSAAAGLGREHVSRQRAAALWLTAFSAVRTLAWLACMLVIVVHWMGAGGSFIHAFTALSSSVLFVTFISFYCNASTDAANFTAGLAALFSADSHGAAEAARLVAERDFAAIEGDIARLADTDPGQEAQELADQIRARIRAAPRA